MNPAGPASPSARVRSFAFASLLVVAGILAYSTGLRGPFVLDDEDTLLRNPSLHQWSTAFLPPPALTTSGRPVANALFTANYVWGGENPAGYHVVNVGIHLAASLLLFGLVRRTLLLPRGSGAHVTHATLIGALVAAVWCVHPLQTEAVTYAVQRVESLMGFFYLLTLYAFVRGAEGAGSRTWLLLSVVACLLGMGTKEVMASAPIMVLLYDRTFIGGSFRAAWRRRKLCYLLLAGTWLWLGYLVFSGGDRAGTAGFNVPTSRLAYGLTQAHAVVHYLRLAFWPHPLVFDYGTPLLSLGQVAPELIAIGLLLAVTTVALWRWPALGFAAAAFFLILAPSSSVVPVATQTIAEHRMYLPLAAVVALVVIGVYRWIGVRSLVVFAALVPVLAFATAQRNRVYRSAELLWRDTVRHAPENSRAYNNLGKVLVLTGNFAEAQARFETCLRLKPDYMSAQNNFGYLLSQQGRWAEAIPHYEAALRLSPGEGEPEQNLGDALLHLNRLNDALPHFARALKKRPDLRDLQENNLGIYYLQTNQTVAAIPHFEAAVRLRPKFAEAHNNLANALAAVNRVDEAIRHYETALTLLPTDAGFRFNLGNARLQQGNYAAAISAYEEALRMNPRLAEAHNNLGYVLAKLGRRADARDHFAAAIRLKPDFKSAHDNLLLIESNQQF